MSKNDKNVSIRKRAEKLAQSKKKSKVGFLQGLKEELKKVSWTTKDELRTCTKIVLGSIFALGIGIYFVDLGLKNCLDGVGLIARSIGA